MRPKPLRPEVQGRPTLSVGQRVNEKPPLVALKDQRLTCAEKQSSAPGPYLSSPRLETERIFCGQIRYFVDKEVIFYPGRDERGRPRTLAPAANRAVVS